MNRVPLLIVGGFLGSGKTTFINDLLSTADDRRFAVLVNDFGQLDVDARLIAGRGAEAINLTNGCICCSMGSGLDSALTRVLGHHPAFDMIVIESNGVADPASIAQVGVADPSLQLEAVVVIQDVTHLAAQLRDPRLTETVARQIRASSVLILNKVDLALASQLQEAHDLVIDRFGDVPIVDTTESRVPRQAFMFNGLLLRRSSQWAYASDPGHTDTVGRKSAPVAPIGVEVDHDHDHESRPHPFQSGHWSCEGTLSANRLIDALKHLPRSVLRVKGWVVTDRHGQAVVQVAGGRVRIERTAEKIVEARSELVYVYVAGSGADDIVDKLLSRLNS